MRIYKRTIMDREVVVAVTEECLIIISEMKQGVTKWREK